MDEYDSSKDHDNVAMLALADMVQTLLQNSTYQVVGFVLFAADGTAEVRSTLDYDSLKDVLIELAEEF